MRPSTLKKLESEIQKEKYELEDIEAEVKSLKVKLLDDEPEHFSKRDILDAFFGALIIGLTFVFKGSLLEIGTLISFRQVLLIILATVVILTAQIYYVGYSKVKNKKKRHFGQFWFKRLLTLYLISLIVSLYLVYIFGISHIIADKASLFRIIIIISMPSALGAAVPSLIRKF
ncbi:DUF2391 family protein [Candidatus Woesearchaeota archaeon]|nr:DUF2391 family protein [Candidatus Woesearchaeota archaeon]